MRFNRVAVWSCVMMLTGVAGLRGLAAADDTSGFAAADAQILSEVREHSEAMQNLEYLSDHIGARLTGSAQLKQGNDWTAEQMKKYGLVNVHLEPVDDCTFLDARYSQSANHRASGTSVDDCFGGLGARNQGCGTRAGGLF